MIFAQRSFLLLLLGAALTACSALPLSGGFGAPTETLAPSDTPVPALPTATIDWFPSTPTFTPAPFATQTATPEMRPGLGQTTLTDSFTDEELWDTAASANGSASIGRSRLTLVAQPEIYMLSLRHQPALTDFYAEITARPNLCRGDDTYGLLVRASASAYYRFSLSCNGTVSADRVSVRTRQALHEEVPSGDAPRGSPGEVRIGVWAVGPEMRLFLNGRYQFTVRNANHPSGTLGVFVRAGGDTPVTINFSDLVVQDVDYVPPAPDVTPDG